MVLLGGLDLVESRPEVAPAKQVVGGHKVIVAFTFFGACYAGVVGADRMMATRVAVCSHVSCEFEHALASAAAVATIAPAAAAAASAATAVASAATAAAITTSDCLGRICDRC
jgi:hypothetical protein